MTNFLTIDFEPSLDNDPDTALWKAYENLEKARLAVENFDGGEEFLKRLENAVEELEDTLQEIDDLHDDEGYFTHEILAHEYGRVVSAIAETINENLMALEAAVKKGEHLAEAIKDIKDIDEDASGEDRLREARVVLEEIENYIGEIIDDNTRWYAFYAEDAAEEADRWLADIHEAMKEVRLYIQWTRRWMPRVQAGGRIVQGAYEI